MIKRFSTLAYATVRRITIAVVGGSVVLVGLIMLVAPGPAIVVVPIGLAILSIEFAFARNWLHKFRRQLSDGNARLRGAAIETRRDAANGSVQ